MVGIYLSAFFAMVFWSLSFIWYKEVLVLYKPVSLVLLRLIISSILLFVVVASIGKLNKIRKEDIKTFIFLSFLSPFLYFLGESSGVNLTPSTLAAVIIAMLEILAGL